MAWVSAAELSWRRVNDMSEIVQVGQEVTVMVLDVDLERE
jgi:small subunit ribosomal protein S1